jgi:hypothetical protein
MFKAWRPTPAHSMRLAAMSHCLPLRLGRHHFFLGRSLNATLSSMASASIRLSFVFSSSSAFSRLASDMSMPLPFEDAGVAHAMLPAALRDGHARLLVLFMFWSFRCGQNELQAGFGQRCNVAMRTKLTQNRGVLRGTGQWALIAFSFAAIQMSLVSDS